MRIKQIEKNNNYIYIKKYIYTLIYYKINYLKF